MPGQPLRRLRWLIRVRLYLAVAEAFDKLVDAVGLNLGAISFAESAVALCEHRGDQGVYFVKM